MSLPGAPSTQPLACLYQRVPHAFAACPAGQPSRIGTEIGTEAFGTEKKPDARRTACDITSGYLVTYKRRGRDSNPRYVLPYTAFPVPHLRPLGHLSGAAKSRRLAGSRSRFILLGHRPRSIEKGTNTELRAGERSRSRQRRPLHGSRHVTTSTARSRTGFDLFRRQAPLCAVRLADDDLT